MIVNAETPDTRPAMTMREIREHLGHTIPPDAPAVWVDGDPLMEAIAAAVWELCETEDTSLVVDDPRTIAAVAAAVARASSPVDRAAVLREAADIADEVVPPDLPRDDRDQGRADAAADIRKWADHVERDALRLMADEAPQPETQATTVADEIVAAMHVPCSFPPCDTGPGEPCDTHERLWAHAEGEHELCGLECAAVVAQLPEAAEGAQQ